MEVSSLQIGFDALVALLAIVVAFSAFVRKNVYEALGGFRPYHTLEDYDFTQRMEKYGPTLYLPETIVASAHKFKHQKFKATLVWLTVQTLFTLGLPTNKLTYFRAKLLPKL